ncbi:MAG: hypothetical protein AAGU73_11810, partial [Actinomycetota bacterium]
PCDATRRWATSPRPTMLATAPTKWNPTTHTETGPNNGGGPCGARHVEQDDRQSFGGNRSFRQRVDGSASPRQDDQAKRVTMSSDVTIDYSDSFDRDLKKLMKDEIKGLAQSWQKMFNDLSKRYAGKPDSTIKPVLRREWKKLGGSPSDRDLTEYANLISEGTDIKVKLK